MSDLKEELNNLRIEYGTFSKKECDSEISKEYEKILAEEKNDENIPNNVTYEFDYNSGKHIFYSGIETKLTQNEIYEYIKYKELGFIKTIKNCILFFTTCFVISLVLDLILFLLIWL